MCAIIPRHQKIWEKKFKKKTFKNNCIYYRDIWRNTAHKEHNILGINIEQRVCAQSFAFLNKLLLVCGALTRNGEENFPMSAQPRKRIQRFIQIVQRHRRSLFLFHCALNNHFKTSRGNYEAVTFQVLPLYFDVVEDCRPLAYWLRAQCDLNIFATKVVHKHQVVILDSQPSVVFLALYVQNIGGKTKFTTCSILR